MSNYSYEKIIENVLSNEKYLKSDKRVYRLILSNLTKGVISVYGEHNVGKKLFIINMMENIFDYNKVKFLIVTDKASKEEMAIRVATTILGTNPFELKKRVGLDKAMNKMTMTEIIDIIEKNDDALGLVREFAARSNSTHNIVFYDNAKSSELVELKNLADDLGIIIITTVLYPNEYDRPDYKNLQKIIDSSNVILNIRESYLDCNNECMEVRIIKNMLKEQDNLKLVVNQYRQRVYEPYEINKYGYDDEMPF